MNIRLETSSSESPGCPGFGGLFTSEEDESGGNNFISSPPNSIRRNEETTGLFQRIPCATRNRVRDHQRHQSVPIKPVSRLSGQARRASRRADPPLPSVFFDSPVLLLHLQPVLRRAALVRARLILRDVALVAVLDQRGQLLRAALGFAGLPRPSYDRSLLRREGLARDVYVTGLEHSPTGATGSAWEPTPWRAV